MLNDITIVECEVMSHLVRLRGKDTVQCAHCALRRRQSRSMRLTSPTSQERIRNQALSRLAQWLLQVLMLRGKKKKCCPQPSRSHQRRTQREDSLLNSAQLTKSSKFSVRDQNPIRNQLCLVSVASIAWECSSKYTILGRKH